MTTIRDRSMEAELLEGTCDGTYKRICIDRSNYPDPDRRLQIKDRGEPSTVGWTGTASLKRPRSGRPTGASVVRCPAFLFAGSARPWRRCRSTTVLPS